MPQEGRPLVAGMDRRGQRKVASAQRYWPILLLWEMTTGKLNEHLLYADPTLSMEVPSFLLTAALGDRKCLTRRKPFMGITCLPS